jgi:long-chain acyl-CoA synthetase
MDPVVNGIAPDVELDAGIASANLYERFRLSARRFADCPALKAKGGLGRTYTYAQVDQLVIKGAAILGGVDEPLIGLIGENKPEWPIAYLAILAAGKTVVPIDCNLKPAEIAAIVRHSGVKTIIASGKCQPVISELNLSLKTLLLDSDSSGYWINNSPDDTRPADSSVAEVAVIIYTSGTTGDPKAVELTHRNLLSNQAGISNALAFSENDTFLSVLPLHHTFEASCGFLTPMCNGCCIVYARSLKSREILEDLAANNVTIMCGVPLLFEKMYHAVRRGIHDAPIPKRLFFWAAFGVSRMLRHFGLKIGVPLFRSFRRKTGLATIRMFVSGGAPLPRAVSRFFNVVGFEFLQGYGMTECSPVVTVNRPDDNRFGSVGPPLFNVRVKIDKPDADGIGEICVRGENTTPGYRGNPERTAELIRDGWLHTGDLGRFHKGHLWITGRAKNVIISAAGKNIYPEEIEEHLLASPYIMEAVVVGLKKGNEGEAVWAVLVPDLEQFRADTGLDPAKPDQELIRTILSREVETVNNHSSDYKRIVGFDISLTELEKTSTKKVRRQLYLSSDSGPHRT